MSQVTPKIRDILSKRVKLSALGNSNRSLKDVAIDLINASGQSYKEVSSGAYLHPTTIKKLVNGDTRNPQSETIERIYRHFDVRVKADMEVTKPKFYNKPKRGRGE